MKNPKETMKIEVTVETKSTHTFEVDLNNHLGIEEDFIRPQHVLEYTEHIQDLKDNPEQWLENFEESVKTTKESRVIDLTTIE